jgi:hypothetical protein
MVGESAGDELDNEFDLDIRIDDIDPAEPDRIHRALTFGTSCTMCCKGETGGGMTYPGCLTRDCSEYSKCLCTDHPC